jgi:hypothetical protein
MHLFLVYNLAIVNIQTGRIDSYLGSRGTTRQFEMIQLGCLHARPGGASARSRDERCLHGRSWKWAEQRNSGWCMRLFCIAKIFSVDVRRARGHNHLEES